MNRKRIEALQRDGIGQLALARLVTKAFPYALQTRIGKKPVMDEIEIVAIARHLCKKEYGKPVADASTIIVIMTDVLKERHESLMTLSEGYDISVRTYVDQNRLFEEAYTDTIRAFEFTQSLGFAEAEVAASTLWL